MKRLRSRPGFTLLEMMIVLAAISILTLILSQTLPFLKQRTRDSARIATLANLRRVIELYRQDNGTYPNAGIPYSFTENDGFAGLFSPNQITTNYIPSIVPTYYDVLPLDPFPGASTVPGCDALGYSRNWAYFTNGDHYKLIVNCASETGLLDPNDPFVDPGSCVAGSCSAWAVSDNMDYTTNVLGWQ